MMYACREHCAELGGVELKASQVRTAPFLGERAKETPLLLVVSSRFFRSVL